MADNPRQRLKLEQVRRYNIRSRHNMIAHELGHIRPYKKALADIPEHGIAAIERLGIGDLHPLHRLQNGTANLD